MAMVKVATFDVGDRRTCDFDGCNYRDVLIGIANPLAGHMIVCL